ncbi:MAG: hypothetical protein D6723_08700 [Acidobacteria bacterium]|nr:MAG: hypothetical protein D6723_08700 [Acidobacteriota bacterium]
MVSREAHPRRDGETPSSWGRHGGGRSHPPTDVSGHWAAAGRAGPALVATVGASETVNWAQAAFRWMQGHPLVILAAALLAIGLGVWWAARRLPLWRIRPSPRRQLLSALMMWGLMGGAYALDARYYFGLYDRSIHLPLFFIQLGLALIGGACFCSGWRPSHSTRPRRLVAVGLSLAVGLTTSCFLIFDDHPSIQALFWSRSVVARRTIALAQWLGDLDGDGFASILGGGDCDDGDPDVNPLAPEIPDNGIDDNCLGGDWTTPDSPIAMPAPHRPAGGRPGRSRSILLITIDALRADHLGCYGYRRPTSPHLDAFAGEGQLFLHAYSQGTNTGHSFASMFRSAYGEAIFDDRRPSFVEILAEHGYATAFFSARRIGRWLRGATWAHYKPILLKGFQFQAHTAQRGQWSADVLTERLIAYLKTVPPNEPFFIWAHYLEPHYPYRRHPSYDFGDRPLDRYDGEIAYTDRALGELFQYLKSADFWPHTLVIITSDHGEAFYEHGLREHSSRPYQEEIHVPLIVRHPARPPLRFDSPVGLIDLAPTILRFAGIDPPVVYAGVDLFAAPGERPIFSETPRNLPEPPFYAWAMIDGRWKLLYDLVGHTFELYDLASDPGERRNLIEHRPAKAQELKAKFGRWFDAQSMVPIHSGDWQLRRILKK